MRRIVAECVERSGLDSTYIKLELSRGVIPNAEDGRDLRQAKQRFVACAVPYIWLWGEEKSKNGGNMHVSSRYKRIPAESVDARFKNYARPDFIQARLDAYEVGCDDCLLVGIDGALTEGSGCNVMLVNDGRIGTPDANVLLGVTRRTALELCELVGEHGGFERSPVHAEKLGRHPLADLAFRLGIGDELVLAVGVHIDEAGRDREPRDVERSCRRDSRQVSDRRNPCPGYTHVSRTSRRSASIDDRTASQHQVEALLLQ